MGRKTALVKISGDLCGERPDVIKRIRELAEEYFIVICVGGGKQINEAFKQAGFPVKQHGPLGRETESFDQRQLARDILERNQAELQDLFSEQKVSATVIIPVLDIGSVLCHVNGDVFVKTVYLGYDQIYIFTFEDRAQKKQEEFKDLPKVQVIGFPEEEPKE